MTACEYRSGRFPEAWCLRRQRPDSDDLKRQALCPLGIRFWPFPPPLRETGYALCGRYSTQKNMHSQGIAALAQKPSRIFACKCLTLHTTIFKLHVAQKELFVGIRIIDFLSLVISHLRRAFEEGFWAGVGSLLTHWCHSTGHPYSILV